MTLLRSRVLCMDESPATIEAWREALAPVCVPLVVHSAAEALELLAFEPGLSALITRDAAMLPAAWANAPRAARILVARNADPATLAGAVNEGRVFRVLLEPHGPDALRAATRDALAMQGGDDGVSPAWIDGLLARLEHAERDAASVRIAGGIGHELNNSLTIYLAVISLLREGIVPEEDELRALQRVGDHLRMQGAQLSRLGARPPECTTVIDLRDALSETVAVLGTAGRLRHLRVDLEAGDQALPVLADRRRIEQMLLSVFLFATASIAEARRLHGEIRAYARCDDDGDVCVTVADNGTGVGTDVINGRDARPNEQAREVGMLIVQQIAMSAGGSVRVERNEGTGSRLSFRFPRATQQAAASSA